MKAGSDDEWELSKENIQPIQQGRKQKVLKVALAPHPEDLILQQRHAFEHELRTYAGTDILSVWCKYIKWVEQNFPKGGREGQIKQLIERCLGCLNDEKLYYDDERFMDILLKYANISEKPLEIFNYMYSHNIGCKLAKFFITWSWELEQLGNFKRADQVISEGIQRHAEPLEKIKAYRKEFDMRFACKIRDGAEIANFESDAGRSAFAMLKPQKQRLAPVSRTGEAVIDSKNPLLLGRQPQPNPTKVSVLSKVPFKIYNSENVAPSLPMHPNPLSHSIFNSENSKENEQKPSKWNKVKVKPRSHITRPSNEVNPGFKFHCDDENGQENFTPRSLPKTSTVLSSRCRTPSPVMALFESPDPLKKPMYPKCKVYGGAEEYSLEEIRAAEWLEKKKIKDQELKLKEQERLIMQQVKVKEELEKEINQLTNKMKLLKNHADVSAPITGQCPSVTRMGIQNSKNEGESSDIKDTDAYYQSNPDSNFLLHRHVTLMPTNDFNGTSENNFSFPQHSNKSQSNTADTFDASKTNSTSYHEASKMVQDLYNRTLSHSVNNSDGRTTDLNSHFKGAPVPPCIPVSASVYHNEEQASEENKQINEMPFELYYDPTLTVPCMKNTKTSSQSMTSVSKTSLSNLEHPHLVRNDQKENKNDLPFAFFHDATEDVHQSVQAISQRNIPAGYSEGMIDQLSCVPGEENVDAENIPPKDYVQEKCQRELSGILEPSKNILFIPLEEQQEELQDVIDVEDDDCQPCNKNINETLIPPSNTEQFSSDMFSASTPFISRSKEKKVHLTDSQSENIALVHINLPQNNNFVKKNISSKDNESAIPKLEGRTPITEEGPKYVQRGLSNDQCLPKMLSAIMETSSENYSKSSSSSSSSASFTKSGHLDPNHFSSIRKPHLKLDTLSSIVEVPDSTLNVVDFYPFDCQETCKHLKSVDFRDYANFYMVNKSLKSVRVGENFNTGKSDYRIECLIAEGAYAKVYQASKLFSFNSDLNLSEKVALKVCKNSNEWEFFLCCEIHKRLAKQNCKPNVENSFMKIMSAVKFSDGIVLVNEYSGRGTLLDIINFYKAKNSSMPEAIVMYLTLEILHIVSRLHELNIIHSDIKPDNFLIMNSAFEVDALKHLSLSTTTLCLIDFGRAIDLNQYKKGICFATTLSDVHFKCVEMRENKPWVFQLDWYGVLCCIHAMIFSEYMSVMKKNDKWVIQKKFKRYWYTALWEPLFSELLNIPTCYEEPNVKKFIHMIEVRLRQNSRSFILELQRLSDSYFKNTKFL